MRAFAGYEKARIITDTERIPVGGYVVKILNAEEVTFKNGGRGLKLSFDVVDGDYKDFFKKNYEQQRQEDRKWKGNIMLFVPKEDGSEMDEWTANKFKTNMSAIEESNSGYHWDWNEQGLKGKVVGAVFRNKEYEDNGSTRFFSECCQLKTVEAIREGKYKIPKDKLLNKVNTNAPDGNIEGFIPTDDEDLPF